MSVLSSGLRRVLESACTDGRVAAEAASRAALVSLAVTADRPPPHLSEDDRRLRRGLRAKARQLGDTGDSVELLVADCAYEQWHRLLFARFLAENNLLIHPDFKAPVTLADCDELAEELGEPDGWSVAARFASQILPGIFRLDDPCVQVRLAPEGRLALEKIVADLPAEVFAADDALGWVYQFWQKQKKDEVNASERKIGGGDLGPVTQLFTENYMVRFLLENSLGAWWAARRPDSPLIKDWGYLRFNAEGAPAAGSFDGWPDVIDDVTVMDPCCGSGHFLVEAFKMLWRMRVEENGLDPVAAQDAVLRDNLFGLELDPRCVQIAMFAVALQAWKDGGGWRQLPTPNIACSGIPVKAPVQEWKALSNGDRALDGALTRLHVLFRNADTLGTLVDPRRVAGASDGTGQQTSMEDVSWPAIAPLIQESLSSEANDPSTTVLGHDAAGIARAADFLSRDYTLVATNVPFLGRGNQSTVLRTFIENNHPSAVLDLAGAMLLRCLGLVADRGTLATVSPQTWTYLSWWKSFREILLSETSLPLIAKLGPGAFSGISGEVVQVVLALIVPKSELKESTTMYLADFSEVSGPSAKADSLRTGGFARSSISQQLKNPESRILADTSPGTLLSEIACVYAGSKPGQTPRVVRNFWEIDTEDDRWLLMSSGPGGGAHYSGKDVVIMRPEEMVRAGITGFDTVGGDARGRTGVLMAKMGSLPVSLYDGTYFDDNTYAIIPNNRSDTAAIYTWCRSDDFRAAVRSISQKTAVPVGAVAASRIEIEKWRSIAKTQFPNGLPEPWSDDPTQWLFEGLPEVSTDPLHVGVARLLGFRWPAQSKLDSLDGLSDSDGIVCLPSVSGERTAADRLDGLLARAFDGHWTPSKIREALERSGSKKATLDHWLIDEFFASHCKLFQNRPFIWHIWDGRKDGFAVLVNYHRLDRANLQRLTYTYLGDWIERQAAGVRDDVPGAEDRLAAAKALQRKLELILEGEPPYDIYVRWKELHEQPIGWDPDLNDGVRLNIRPFVEAGILRSKFNIHWKKDRGKNPDGSERHNDLHYTNAEKLAARREAGV